MSTFCGIHVLLKFWEKKTFKKSIKFGNFYAALYEFISINKFAIVYYINFHLEHNIKCSSFHTYYLETHTHAGTWHKLDRGIGGVQPRVQQLLPLQ